MMSSIIKEDGRLRDTRKLESLEREDIHKYFKKMIPN